jgi:hypothetical protein
MSERSTATNVNATRAMLEAFASVGAKTFDLTLTTLQGQKIRFRKNQPLNALIHAMPAQIDGAGSLQYNVIVRPHGPAVFIQLDDLNRDAVERVKPAAFLALQTSPGNYQAWVALRETEDGMMVFAGIGKNPQDKDFARRLRKGAGADDSASGATRVAGSLNFKEKYAPDFPRVEIAYSAPGLFATKDQLEGLGLVAAPEAAPPALHRVSPAGLTKRKWPSYERCLEGAPPNHGKTGPDISRADFTWCMTAITWGWSVEDTSDKLMELSGKARENGESYALRTSQNAASAVERRRTAHR